jgi:membrane protein
LLFTLGKSAIGTYLGSSGIASGFGAAASLVAMVVWVYYSAQIFLLGAEFTKAYAGRHGSQRTGIQAERAPEGQSAPPCGVHARSARSARLGSPWRLLAMVYLLRALRRRR